MVRATCTAECVAATAAADETFPILITLQEFRQGPMQPRQAMELRANGGLVFQFTLTIDALSACYSIKSLAVKLPAEKTIAVHLLWLRRLVDSQVLTLIRWCDTRDMSSDGHTKGIIDRAGLIDAMSGKYGFQCPTLTHPRHRQLSQAAATAISETTTNNNNNNNNSRRKRRNTTAHN